MDDLILSEAVLQTKDDEIRRIAKRLDRIYAINADDQVYGRAFRNYLLFSNPAHLVELGFPKMDQQTILYNRYYWFLKFLKLHQAKEGFDAGMEQQAFKSLENAESKLDWSVVEEISRLAEREGDWERK